MLSLVAVVVVVVVVVVVAVVVVVVADVVVENRVCVLTEAHYDVCLLYTSPSPRDS